MTKMIAMVVALAACATPYQQMGVTGGYSDKRLPNGDYVITVKVNAFTGRETALEYLHRRADELCPGGYDLVDRSDGDNGDFRTGSKPEANGVVRCKDRAALARKKEREIEELRRAQRREQARLAVATPPPPRGFFCSSNATANFCVRDKAECQRTRDISISALPDLSECTLVEIAWCFGDRCTTTEESCVVQLARAVEGGQLHSECAEAR